MVGWHALFLLSLQRIFQRRQLHDCCLLLLARRARQLDHLRGRVRRVRATLRDLWNPSSGRQHTPCFASLCIALRIPTPCRMQHSSIWDAVQPTRTKPSHMQTGDGHPCKTLIHVVPRTFPRGPELNQKPNRLFAFSKCSKSN